MKQHCDNKYGWLALIILMVLVIDWKLVIGLGLLFIVLYAIASIDVELKKKQDEWRMK